MTRRIISFVLATTLCLVALSGCSGDTGTPSCESCAEAVLMSQSSMPEMTFIGFESADAEAAENAEGNPFGEWIQSVYGIDPSDVTDGAVYYADGASAAEIAVLRFERSSGAGAAARNFKKYVDERKDTFSGYAPDAVKMLDDALVIQHSDYVSLIVVPSPTTAEIAFDGSFHVPDTPSEEAASEEPTETRAETAAPTEDQAVAVEGETEADMPISSYSHDAVLSAWQNGDPSSLGAQDRDVYDAAVQIISETTNDSMSPYEKERAVHDRLVETIDYDALALARDSSDAAPPESSTPYGALVLGQAICYGYSGSFQLLMDMLGIECITVDGTINDDNDPHSWNMVNLDGSWYIVDVTWDDPIGGSLTYNFFNRTQEECTGYNRRWDRNAYPAAEGGVWEGPDANGV